MNKSSFYRWGFFVLALACALVFVPLALGAPKANNYLDPTFDGDGIVTTTFNATGALSPVDMLVLSDNKLMVVGTFVNNLILVRLLPDGQLDTSFGSGGRVINLNFAHYGKPARALLQADGKILVVSGDAVAVGRFNPDGSVDGSYGSNGFFSTPGSITDLALQPDGKLVVAAYDYSAGNGLLLRLTTSGLLDPAFGAAGRVASSAYETFTAVAVSPQSQIVATLRTESELQVRRYGDQGQLDPGFGNAGIATIIASEANAQPSPPSRIAIGSDSKIVLASNSTQGTLLARLTASGTLDPTFSADGYTFNYLLDNNPSSVRTLLLQPDGAILVAGTIVSMQMQFVVARFEPDGDLDASFASGGKYLHAGSNLAGLAIQAGSRLVLAAGNGEALILVGLTSAGTPDSTFGAPEPLGHSIIRFLAPREGRTEDVLVAPDGKILAVGSSLNMGVGVLARYNADGSPDTNFGSGGSLWLDNAEIYGVTLDAENRILVVGSVFTQGLDFMVSRLNSDGSPDSTFGTGGRVTFNYIEQARTEYNRLYDVAVTPEGKILVSGIRTYSCGNFCTTPFMMLVRLNSNGSFDTAFGDGGTVMESGGATELALQPDGKIVVAGSTRANSATAPFNFRLWRFSSDGTLDPSFDGRLPLSDSGHAMTVELLPNGDLVAAGITNTASGDATVVARYKANGTPDPSFDGDGYVLNTAVVGYGNHNLAVDAAGRILVGSGIAEGGVIPLSYDAVLLRFSSAGAPDASFGTNGVLRFDDRGGSEVARAVAIQPDGKVVVGIAGAQFTVARVLDRLPAPTPTIGPGCIFSDVCGSEYFFTPVQYLVDHGAISGYGDNTFRPFNETTRGQLAKIVVSAEGWAIDTTGGQHFTDVLTDNPFYSFIETAYHKGIVSGYEDGTFHPYASVTRGQIAKIVVSAEGWAIETPTAAHFSDVTATNTFYGAIETAYSRGIISGYAAGTFKPYSNATRGQIAKIVYAAVTAPTK